MLHDKHQFIRKWLLEPLRFSRWQAGVVVALVVVLAAAYWGPLRTDTANAFWNWIDPVAGIMAFFVSMVVLYNQARERWENSLEKRLTVSFVNANDNAEVARVEHAYLSGESDIRQWAQQLGRQIFGGDLQLDMNWDDQSPPASSGNNVATKVPLSNSTTSHCTSISMKFQTSNSPPSRNAASNIRGSKDLATGFRCDESVAIR